MGELSALNVATRGISLEINSVHPYFERLFKMNVTGTFQTSGSDGD